MAVSFQKFDATDLVKKVWRMCQQAFVIITALLLIAWIISPLRGWLIEKNIFTQSTIFYIVGLAATLLVNIAGEIKSGVNELSKKLDKFNRESDSQIIENGVLHVYPHLNKMLESVNNRKDKTLQVMGLTLYSAWPHIQAWLSLDSTRDWNVRLFAVDSEFTDVNPQVFPKKWVRESASVKEQIEYFIENRKDMLARKSVTIKIDVFHNVPVMHGFRIGDGTLYVAFSHWAPSNLIDDPHYFYEYFHCDDKTLRAKAYKNLFDNWLTYYSNKAESAAKISMANNGTLPVADKVEPS